MTDERHATPRQIILARRELAKGASLKEAAQRCGVETRALDKALWRNVDKTHRALWEEFSRG